MSSLNIGLTVYHAVPGLAFVKVPSERGRWVLTDLCVVFVPCTLCGAIIGEPCRRFHGLAYWDRLMPKERPLAHGVGVHVSRKADADVKLGRGWRQRLNGYKLHLSASDLEEALNPAADPPPEPAPLADIDFPVTRNPT